jgi:hypothetical protein
VNDELFNKAAKIEKLGIQKNESSGLPPMALFYSVLQRLSGKKDLPLVLPPCHPSKT